MKQINKFFKIESAIRALLAIIGILSFGFSADFAWGFILGGIISKKDMNLRTKEGWGLLALTTIVMIIAIYLLLDTPALYGYIFSTILYFVLRDSISYFTINR
jgi:uncharacterized membrane protein YccC